MSSKKTVSIDDMGKDDLRKACKAAQISYGKLSNLQMRDALKVAWARTTIPASAEALVTTPPAAEAPAAVPAEKSAKPARVPAESRGGVTRPKAGSICASIWEACDELIAAGTEITFAALKEKLPKVNDATLRTQKQRHRVFTGAAKEAAK
jgi:hypothetical protein